MYKAQRILFVTVFSLFLFVSSLAIEIEIPNGELVIGGALESSQEIREEAPLVILISGSGAQDRDETVFGFKPFKLIAESLLSKGIPSFRYDDRQVGSSTGVFAEATLSELSRDVEVIMNYFQNSKMYSFRNFILLGHSQGGVVASKVAGADKRVKGVILMASPSIMLKDVISEQVRIMQEAAGKPQEAIDMILEFQESAYNAAVDESQMGKAEEKFKQYLEFEISNLPPAQKSMVGDIDALASSQFKSAMTAMESPQMRSLLFYNPMDDISKLNMPILAVFGAKDTQVPPEQNARVIEDKCQQNKLQCKILVLDNANHLFQPAKSGLANEYQMLPKEFVKDFIPSITDWVEGIIE